MNTSGGYPIPPTITSVLVTESVLPSVYYELASKLGVPVFDSVSVPTAGTHEVSIT